MKNLFTFTALILRHGLSIVALSNYSLITTLAPFGLVVNNALFAIYLICRRREITSPKIDERTNRRTDY